MSHGVVSLVSGSTYPSLGAESLYEHILDNRDRTVVDYLRGGWSDAGLFRVVSAFFTIYEFELLEDVLGGVNLRPNGVNLALQYSIEGLL